MSSIPSTDRLLAVRAPQHASLSADGERLLLTTSHVSIGADTETYINSVVRLADGHETMLHLAGDGHSPVWAPDGQALVWNATGDDGTPVLMVASAVGQPGLELQGTRGCTSTPVWSPDGTHLAYTAGRGTRIDRSQPYRWTRPLAAFDGLGPLEDPPQVWVVEVATGSARQLTDDQWRWSSPEWSPDGGHLAAVVGTDPDGLLRGQHLAVVSLDGSVRQPGLPRCRSMSITWLPDGRLAAMVAEPQADGLGSDAAIFVVTWSDTGAGVRRIDRPFLHGDVYGDSPAALAELYEHVLLSDGTGRLVVRIGRRGRMAVARFHPDSPEWFEVLTDGDRCCSPVAASGDTIVYTTQSSTSPVDLAVVVPGESAERRLTAFAPPTTVEAHRFTVDTADGHVLDGWFLSPAGVDGPVPTVLTIHGGPHFTFGEMFSLDAHALCEAGFGVLYTNPRGSTGYGTAFAQACHGDWAVGPAADLHAVLDHVVAEGWADPQRVGVAGNSYGGYMSAWLVSTSPRFRAAVIENPVTDLVSMYYTSDIGTTFFPPQFGGAPHEALETYSQQSPILRAHECRTPCLFMVGEVDRRCPSAQAWAMHRVLRLNGVPSEVMVLPDCSHEGTTYGPPVARRAADAAVVEWMTRWL